MYEKYIKQLETGTGGGDAVKASIDAMKKLDMILNYIKEAEHGRDCESENQEGNR